jgi:hypothetical protein
MVPKGRCHLCGEEKGLTYEHVPAKSTFNAKPVEMFGLESWLGRTPDDLCHERVIDALTPGAVGGCGRLERMAVMVVPCRCAERFLEPLTM